jgi:2,3-bisphosphoglycerate-dependent phosphoglycerate mutase
MKKLLFLLLFSGFVTVALAQKTTKIWIVRHAEKDTSNAIDNNPGLSAEGEIRAVALLKKLKGAGVDSIFATTYKRTRLTGFPLADKIGLPITTYDVANPKQFAENLLKNAGGKKLLIIAHSNTVLPLIVAFGAKPEIEKIEENDYDCLFEVTLKEGKATLKTERYGVPSK